RAGGVPDIGIVVFGCLPKSRQRFGRGATYSAQRFGGLQMPSLAVTKDLDQSRDGILGLRPKLSCGHDCGNASLGVFSLNGFAQQWLAGFGLNLAEDLEGQYVCIVEVCR